MSLTKWLAFSLITLCSVLLTGCPSPQSSGGKQSSRDRSEKWDPQSTAIKIVVSIPPTKEFVQKIGGAEVQVISMLNPGDDFQQTQPSASKLELLNSAAIFFRNGAGFEDGLTIPDTVKVVDLRENLKTRTFSSHTTYLNGNKDFAKDNYLWMSPSQVVGMLTPVYLTIGDMLPESKDKLQQNFTRFVRELNSLDGDIKRALLYSNNASFYTDYGCLGYFADDYGVKQVLFRQEKGKDLNDLARQAIKDNVHTIFFGPYMPSALEGKLDKLINGNVAQLDPLADNYMDNVLNIAKTIASGVAQK